LATIGCAPQKCGRPGVTTDFSASVVSVIRFSGPYSIRERRPERISAERRADPSTLPAFESLFLRRIEKVWGTVFEPDFVDVQ